jgi:hypothetical protein
MGSRAPLPLENRATQFGTRFSALISDRSRRGETKSSHGRSLPEWSVRQNLPPADRPGVVVGLLERGDESSCDIADFVQRHAP